jgi:membrane-associated phospholipid phosphatase
MEGKMSRTTRLLYLLGFLFLYCSSYFITQAVIKTSEFALLTEIDKSIPFMPEHVWIYHTLLPAIVITMTVLVNKQKMFFNVFWASIVCAVTLNLFYVMFPVFYPRPELIPATLSELVLELTHRIDGAHNTFPSGHVTFAWLMFLGVAHVKETVSTFGIRLLYFLWSIGVMLSTLTLKQHFIADVVAGVALATISFFFVKSFINKFHLYEDN